MHQHACIATRICEISFDMYYLLLITNPNPNPNPKTDNAINGIAEFMSKSFVEETYIKKQ